MGTEPRAVTTTAAPAGGEQAQPHGQPAPALGHRVARNAVLLAAATIVARLSALALTVALGRALGVEQYGLYGFALALSLILQPVADIGMTPYLIREVARDREKADRGTPSLVRVKVLLTLAVLLATAAVALLVSSDAEAIAVVLVMIAATLGDGYSQLIFGYFQGRERMGFEASATTLVAIVRAVGGIALALWLRDLLPVVCWLLTVGVLQVLYATLRLRSAIGAGRPPARARAGAVSWETVLTMGAILALTIVYTRADSVLLGWLQGSRDVGLYTAAFAVMGGLQIPPWMVGTALRPVLARAFGNDPALFQRVWQEGSRIVIVIALPLSLPTSLLADQIVERLYGAQFEAAADALAVLVWTNPLAALALLQGMTLQAAGRERWLVGVAALGALVNVVFNLVMIPRFGILGAAWMTVITEVAIIIAFMWLGLSRRVFTLPRVPLVRLALGALVLAAVSLGLEGLPVEISFIAAMLAYGVAMTATGVISRDDMVMLLSLRRRGAQPQGDKPASGLSAP